MPSEGNSQVDQSNRTISNRNSFQYQDSSNSNNPGESSPENASAEASDGFQKMPINRLVRHSVDDTSNRPRRRQKLLQAITMVIETKEFPYNDGYVWKNNGNTVHKTNGQKSIYYKCSNSNMVSYFRYWKAWILNFLSLPRDAL